MNNNNHYDIPDGIHSVTIVDVSRYTKPDHKAILFQFQCEGFDGFIWHYQIVTPKGFITQAQINQRRDAISQCFSMDFSSNPITDDMLESYIGRQGKVLTFHSAGKNGQTFINIKRFYSRYISFAQPQPPQQQPQAPQQPQAMPQAPQQQPQAMTQAPQQQQQQPVAGNWQNPSEMQYANIVECPF